MNIFTLLNATGLVGGGALLFVAVYPMNALAAEGAVLEEVVVTAEKRAIDVQKMPVSVWAVAAEELERQNLTSILAISSQVPGLTVNKNEGPRQVVTIRGVGFEANQNGQAVAGVAQHRDGIFVPNTRALNVDFIDVDRVEVLRGPQGTVLGQQAVGGVINIISKKPDLRESSLVGDVTFGEYNLLKVRATANFAASDTFAIRATGSYLHHDGFTKVVNSPIAGFQLDNANDSAATVQLLWQPRDNLSLIVRGGFVNQAVHDSAQRNILDPGTDKRRISQQSPGISPFNYRTASVDLNWELPGVTLKSISAYQNADDQIMNRDNDRGVATFITPQSLVASQRLVQTNYSQEFDLVSNKEGAVDWVIGALYLNLRQYGWFEEFWDNNRDGVFTTIDINPRVPAFGFVPGLPDEISFQSEAPTTRHTTAGYAQATWHVSNKWKLTGGFRYTNDELDSVVTTYYGLFGPGNHFTASMHKVTGKVSAQYDFTNTVMGYATVSTGAKPGGANLIAPRPGAQIVVPVFEPETATGYELGVKSRLAESRFQLNAAVFYYDYKNLQFHTENYRAFQGGIANVPKIEIHGGELEFSGVLSDRFRIDMNFTSLGGKVKSDVIALNPAEAFLADQQTIAMGSFVTSALNTALRTARVSNLNGNTPAKLPPFAASVRLTNNANVGNRGKLVSTVVYTYKDSYFYSIFNNGGALKNPSYRLWDLFLAYTPNQGNWNAALMVTNLTNTNAVNARFTNVFGVGSTSDQFADPRQVMLRIGYSVK